MKNVIDTVLSQYANSPTILGLINSFNDAIDPSADLDAFYDNVWNIETAVGFGLDNLGKIVGISRQLKITVPEANFGFKDGANDTAPLGSGTFYNGAPATQVYALTDDAYRQLILMKALANISNCSSPALNKLLQYFFSGDDSGYVVDGYVASGYVSQSSNNSCYVADYGNMTMGYVFNFALTPAQLAVLTSGVMPRPAGVQAYLIQSNPSGTFGFAGTGCQPFGSGTLAISPSIKV